MSKIINYRPEIDGLRALAVLAVFFYHLDITLFKGGFVGVDIFFVISGFLITKIISTQMAQGRFSFAEFYARRVKRIFPALFVMLALTTVAAILFLVPAEYKDFMKAVRYSGMQASNFLFAQGVGYFAQEQSPSALLHTWSLGVEEQFYLVWPLLFFVLYKFKRLNLVPIILSVLTLASLALSQYLVGANQNYAFYLLHARAWELALGGLVALVRPIFCNKIWLNNFIASLGFYFMLGAIFSFDNINFPGVKAFLPCMGAALFLYTTIQKPQATIVARLFALRPIVFVGLISYSLYLWHWPVIAFYKSYAAQPLTTHTQLIMVLVAFVLAWLSYKFVEQPWRHSVATPTKTLAIAVICMLVAIMSSNALKGAFEDAWRYRASFDSNMFHVDFDIDECVPMRQHNIQKWCMRETMAKNFEVLLVGDSHVGHYDWPVRAWAKNQGFHVRYIATPGCPAWFLDKRSTPTFAGLVAQDCIAAQKEFAQALKQPALRYVFLAQNFSGYSQGNATDNKPVQWRKEPIATVAQGRQLFVDTVDLSFKRMRQIANPQVKFVFLSQVPMFEKSPATCHLKQQLWGSLLVPSPACTQFDNAYSQQHLAAGQKIMQRLTHKNHIIYFDPTPFITSSQDSLGRIIYIDGNHLNAYGARVLTPALAKFMRDFK